jgi:uncharacterized protein with ParB-like and HNH nuclease domain
MANGILSPELVTIQQLLSGDTRFKVPKYQRSFAWSKDETEELWEDVKKAVEQKREEYFLGTIVLQTATANSFEIIDGQQRLTCVSMLFSAIRHEFKARNDASRAQDVFTHFLGAKDFNPQSVAQPKLELNEINNPVYVQNIIGSVDANVVATSLRLKGLHESNKKLLEAYKYYLDEVSKIAASKGTQFDEFLVPLIDCLRSSVKLITIKVTSEEDAFLIFESLNARGKELAVSDLVKNRLYLEAKNNVKFAQQLWQDMETSLVRSSIPEYLRHYWIAKKSSESKLTVREKELYRAITQDLKGPSPTIELLRDLELSSRDYARIEDYNLWPDESAYDKSFEDALNELKLFRVSQCYPVLLNAIQLFKIPDKIAKVFRIIANFSFRYNIIGNGTSGSLERIFGEIAYAIRDGSCTSHTDVADTLRATNRDLQFQNDFEIAIVSKSKGKLARYILAKLNNQMGSSEVIANPNAKEVNLEHILPQSITPAWSKEFSNGVDPEEYVYRVGNLTLLNAKFNSNVANKSFQDKQKLAFNKSKLPINSYFNQITKWSEKEIENRQKEMAKVALQVWKL